MSPDQESIPTVYKVTHKDGHQSIYLAAGVHGGLFQCGKASYDCYQKRYGIFLEQIKPDTVYFECDPSSRYDKLSRENQQEQDRLTSSTEYTIYSTLKKSNPQINIKELDDRSFLPVSTDLKEKEGFPFSFHDMFMGIIDYFKYLFTGAQQLLKTLYTKARQAYTRLALNDKNNQKAITQDYRIKTLLEEHQWIPYSLEDIQSANRRNCDDLRNHHWVDTHIEPALTQSQLKKPPSLFVFGTNHLSGNDSILNLLRKKGYAVEGIDLAHLPVKAKASS